MTPYQVTITIHKRDENPLHPDQEAGGKRRVFNQLKTPISFDWLPKWTAIRVYRTIKRGRFDLKPVHTGESNSPF